ncbi:MAG: AAA family ATPase [Rudaea sp.]|nr:AAA family ATPase [Rudaea sp.]
MLSQELRLLSNRWIQNRNNWPQFLDWMEITGVRGWTGQRLDFQFPIVAIVGENGTGKSTVLQAAASYYRPPQGRTGFFASDFFPSTTWESIDGVTIRGFCRQGTETFERSVRKPTTRWLGNPQRRIRPITYLDLRRTQPIYARVGYKAIAKPNALETNAVQFDDAQRARASTILGKQYDAARHATTNLDPSRRVPVLSASGVQYSGFHQGAGENAIADLLAQDFLDNGLVLVDELETSLHPRAQRRIIRDFATIARQRHLQILLTTHSPYVLEELPPEARLYIGGTAGAPRTPMVGVSAEYAMTFMDDFQHPELDIYVEDRRAAILVEELLFRFSPEHSRRVQITAFGAANVGQALGQMVAGNRFPRPTIVVLDGDQAQTAGVHLLPGQDAPERVVFAALAVVQYVGLAARTNRTHASLVDAMTQAATLPDHHDWVNHAAEAVVMGGDDLWRAACSVWAQHCLAQAAVQPLLDDIEGKLGPH